MRISFFVGSLYGGGAERVTCNLANYLVAKGHYVDIITMSESKKTYNLSQDVHNTILLYDLERKNFVYNYILRIRRLKEYLQYQKVDCFIVFLPVTTILLLSLHRYTTAPIIASERVDPKNNRMWEKILLKVLAKRATRFVFQTQIIREWYGKSVEDRKAVIIPNAINKDFFKSCVPIKKEKSLIISVGRLTPQKNFSLLIYSFGEVNKDYPESKLIIYGEGPERDNLETLIQKLGLNNKVFLPGNIDDIKKEMSKAEIFVLSSNFEGMPNCLIEALALGIPCVSTNFDGGGASFLIENGVNGLLVPKNNKSAMSSAIKTLLGDFNLAHRLAEKGKEVIKLLDPDIIYERWEKIIIDSYKETNNN